MQKINTEKSALLVMDCQGSIVNSLPPSEKERIFGSLPKVIAATRAKGMPVIYVKVQFRDDFPEVSPRNVLFSGVKESGRLRETDPNTEICGEVRPQPGEVIVTKRRISAFTGSDLEVTLRSKGIDTLILTGVSTSGVVESTARFAFDRDYRLVIIGDCCADRDPEVHEFLVTRLLPRLGEVCSVADFADAIS